MDISRRTLLALLAGGVFRPDDSPESRMIVRSVRPIHLEMPLAGFVDYLTPLDRFFVRTHVHVPNVDVQEWRLKIEGAVAKPLTLGFDDVRGFARAETVSVLECAGNGRGFYEPSMPGLQWGNGAVGNARWVGTRLGDVLKRAGMKDSATEVLFEGADMPIGTMPDFQRSIPVKKALDPDTLLAFQMNGEPYRPVMGTLCGWSFPGGPAIPGSNGSLPFAYSRKNTTASG